MVRVHGRGHGKNLMLRRLQKCQLGTAIPITLTGNLTVCRTRHVEGGSKNYVYGTGTGTGEGTGFEGR